MCHRCPLAQGEVLLSTLSPRVCVVSGDVRFLFKGTSDRVPHFGYLGCLSAADNTSEYYGIPADVSTQI